MTMSVLGNGMAIPPTVSVVTTAECRIQGTPRARNRVISSAGLLTCGSQPGPPSRGAPQWHVGRRSPPTVAGAAPELRQGGAHRVPFSSAPREAEPKWAFCRRKRAGVSSGIDHGSVRGSAARRRGAVCPLLREEAGGHLPPAPPEDISKRQRDKVGAVRRGGVPKLSAPCPAQVQPATGGFQPPSAAAQP